LAARTFRDAFGADNTPEDLERHLKRSYGISQQSAELANPGMTTLLADHADIPIGYVQLKSGPPPGSVIGNSPFEIMRFYVDQAWHGRGVAHHLMMETIAEARRQGAGTLWLGVWERNPRAIAFYRKWEFTPTGSTIFCVGNDRQNDLVMVRAL
jgi:GNAT superfamily N-acetyltransferase